MHSFANLPVESQHPFLTKLHHFTCINLSYDKTSSNPDFTSSLSKNTDFGPRIWLQDPSRSLFRSLVCVPTNLRYQHFKANLHLKFSKAVYLVFSAVMTLSFRTAFYSLSHGSTVVCAVARTCLDTRVADFLSGILAGEAATERALLISSLGLKPADGLQEIGRASRNLGYLAILSASINTSFSCCHSIRQTSYFPLAVVLLLFCAVLCCGQLQR